MLQLSALDALFLYLETPETPMHVGSLILFQKPKGHRGSFYPAIRRHIESRMHLAPLFTRKLAFMPLDLMNPIWVDEPNIDLDWHLRVVKLPAPGSMAQLEALVARLHEGMLDRDRPLWQFTVIEGLASGEVALATRIHHAALDGQGGVALAQALLDVEPKPARRAAPVKTESKRALPLSTAKMLSSAFRHSVAQYGKIIKAVPGAVKSVGTAFLSSSEARAQGAPSEQMTGVADMTMLARNLSTIKKTDSPLAAAKKLLPAGIKLGPRTRLNVAIGGQRSFAVARIPIDEVKQIARHFDLKLNDVVLATVAGALRSYFAHDKTALSKAMVSAVPVSLRAPGDTTANNQVSMMLIDLATNIADPVKRIAAIKASSAQAKLLSGGMKNTLSTVTSDLPTLGIPWLMSLITPLYQTAVASNRIPMIANVVVSNVPGPPIPLYMAGALMTLNVPVSIVTHGLALNFTVHSYAGSLDYGLIAAKKEVPRLGDLAKYLKKAHAELLAIANAAAPTETERREVAEKPKSKTSIKKRVTTQKSTRSKPTTKPKQPGLRTRKQKTT